MYIERGAGLTGEPREYPIHVLNLAEHYLLLLLYLVEGLSDKQGIHSRVRVNAG